MALFLKAFGVNKLLTKPERPQYGENMVSAQTKNWNASTAVWMHDSF
jgi:hypothetical protein